MRRGAASLLALALALALAAPAARAEPADGPPAEAALPPRHEALLLLRVLAYDRALRGRDDRHATVALAVRPADAAGEARAQALAAAVREAALEFTVAGLPLRAVVVGAERGKLAARLREAGASVVLLVGAAAADPADGCQAAREARVLSAAGSRVAAEACVALGLVSEGGKARILVNLRQARAEGADLDSALLAIAQLVGGAVSGRP